MNPIADPPFEGDLGRFQDLPEAQQALFDGAAPGDPFVYLGAGYLGDRGYLPLAAFARCELSPAGHEATGFAPSGPFSGWAILLDLGDSDRYAVWKESW